LKNKSWLHVLLIFTVFSMLISCSSSHKNPSIEPLDAVTAPPEPVPEIEKEVPDSHIMDIISSARFHFHVGEMYFKAGEVSVAMEEFSQAIDILSESDVSMEEDPRLENAFEELSVKICDLLKDQSYINEVFGEELAPTIQEELSEDLAELTQEEAEIQRVEVEERTREVVYDIPIVLNREVLTYLEHFKTRRRKVIHNGLVRSGRYVDMMKRIFIEEGLPEDLIYLSMVESLFKPNACSRVRAKGLWQFMKGTGIKYNLQINWWVDERYAPEKATRAAAHYLKDLYAMFGDWYLAMAAYNAGEGKIGRAIKYTGKNDFWELAKTHHIKRETKNFVPQILASIIIAKNPEEHGFFFTPESPVEYDRVSISECISLDIVARCCSVSVDRIRDLNPELSQYATPGTGKAFDLKIPNGKKEAFTANLSAIPKEKRMARGCHLVRRGETLSVIAKRYGTTVRAICQVNKIHNPHRIKPGQRLVVPPGAWKSGSWTEDNRDPAGWSVSSDGEKIIYVVRRGDSLYSIARRYHTSVKNLCYLNNLSSKKKIYPGDKIVINRGKSAGFIESAGEGPKTYRVRKGDTLYHIARNFNTSVYNLKRWNKLRSNRIYPGDILAIYN